MGVLRILPLLVFLAGCAASIPLLQPQENIATTVAQPDDRPTTEASSEQAERAEQAEELEKAEQAEDAPQAEKAEKPIPPAPKPATASKAAKASKSSHKTTIGSTTPKVGSPEWKKEREEDERKEQHIKEVMESICRGC